MTDKRFRWQTASRFRMTVIVALLAAFALGSFWVLDIMRRGIDDTLPDAHRTAPDYFVEKFVFVRMSKTGQVQYNVAGDRLTHFPLDDSSEIQQPVLNSRSNPQSPMTIRAARATVDHGNVHVRMIGQVRMDRPQSTSAERFHLASESLMILPDDDVMQTEQAIDMTFGASHLTGVGMVLNNATGEFRLSHKVRGTYRTGTHDTPADPG